MQYKTQIVNNIEECKSIWSQLVDIKTLYDNWDFRYAFYNSKYPLNFVVAYNDDKPIGLLALQQNTDNDYLEFFGGNFMENNRIYAKENTAEVSNFLINTINSRVKLSSLIAESSYIKSFKFMDNTYDLDISQMNSLEDLLETNFRSHKRKNFRKILRDFEDVPHKIEFDRWDDLEKMMTLNMERFEEESAFNEYAHREAFRTLMDSELKVRIMTILINDIPENISLFVEFNDIFYAMMSGTNIELEYDLRKYSLLRKFEYAIENKFKTFDAGRNDCNWKENWHLTPHPLYIYKNFD
jgi:hypothetical protein